MKTYWTVKASFWGANAPIDLYFKEYEHAKAESCRDYRDKPVKHTVKDYKYTHLENVGAFED